MKYKVGDLVIVTRSAISNRMGVVARVEKTGNDLLLTVEYTLNESYYVGRKFIIGSGRVEPYTLLCNKDAIRYLRR